MSKQIKFKFDANKEHQLKAVESTVKLLEGLCPWAIHHFRWQAILFRTFPIANRFFLKSIAGKPERSSKRKRIKRESSFSLRRRIGTWWSRYRIMALSRFYNWYGNRHGQDLCLSENNTRIAEFEHLYLSPASHAVEYIYPFEHFCMNMHK